MDRKTQSGTLLAVCIINVYYHVDCASLGMLQCFAYRLYGSCRNSGCQEVALPFFARSLYQYLVQRSEEHTSELQSLMRISYAVFCLKKKTKTQKIKNCTHENDCKNI